MIMHNFILLLLDISHIAWNLITLSPQLIIKTANKSFILQYCIRIQVSTTIYRTTQNLKYY